MKSLGLAVVLVAAAFPLACNSPVEQEPEPPRDTKSDATTATDAPDSAPPRDAGAAEKPPVVKRPAVPSAPKFKGEKIPLYIYWANRAGQRIHSPTQAYPDNYKGVQHEVSLEGTYVCLQLNRTKCRDVNDLARKLADLGARNPSAYISIAVASIVPWKWVALSIDACSRARIPLVAMASGHKRQFNPASVLVHEKYWQTSKKSRPRPLPFVMMASDQRPAADRTITVRVFEGKWPGSPVGILTVHGRIVGLDNIGEALASHAGAPAKTAVYIEAAAEAVYGPVLKTMRAAEELGIRDITFAVVRFDPKAMRNLY